MDIYVVTIDAKVQPESFTSLAGACKFHGLGYQFATKGKRIWVTKYQNVIIITQTDVHKIAGRGQDIIGQKSQSNDNQEY